MEAESGGYGSGAVADVEEDMCGGRRKEALLETVRAV